VDEHGNLIQVFALKEIGVTTTVPLQWQALVAQNKLPATDLASTEPYLETAYLGEQEREALADVVEGLGEASRENSLSGLLAWLDQREVPEDAASDLPGAGNAAPPEAPEPERQANLVGVLNGEYRSSAGEALLLTSLARMLGLPSRVVVGVEYATGQRIPLTELIAWSEIFDPAAQQWVLVHPTRGRVDPNAYLALRILTDDLQILQRPLHDQVAEAIGVRFDPGAATVTVN
jgi:hypothetical protein